MSLNVRTMYYTRCFIGKLILYVRTILTCQLLVALWGLIHVTQVGKHVDGRNTYTPCSAKVTNYIQMCKESIIKVYLKDSPRLLLTVISVKTTSHGGKSAVSG